MFNSPLRRVGIECLPEELQTHSLVVSATVHAIVNSRQEKDLEKKQIKLKTHENQHYYRSQYVVRIYSKLTHIFFPFYLELMKRQTLLHCVSSFKYVPFHSSLYKSDR